MPFINSLKIAGTLVLGLIFTTTIRGADLSWEIETKASYVGSTRTDLTGGRDGRVSEEANEFRAVVSPQIKEGFLLRAGVEWQRYSFDVPQNSGVPNSLQSASLVIGMDMQLGESWLVRVEATPGFYGTPQFTGDAFNVPLVIGGSYLASPDLQWVLGIEVNPDGEYPVLPGAGVRWKFADRWVFNAILPTPRLEYEFSKSLTGYAGFDFKTGSYRTSSNFGTVHGNPKLNNAAVEYMEFRAGVGASWKLGHHWTLETEAGYMPYRKFDYFRIGTNIETDNGAPYGQISIRAHF